MTSKPRKQKDEKSVMTHNFLLEELSCPNVFDKFREDAQNGSIVGFAGDDFAIIAVDSSCIAGSCQALHKMTNKLVLGTTGDQCCTAQLASNLRARLFMNEYLRRRTIPSQCVALLLSCILTNQRYHEGYVSTMLAGLDHLGKGAIYAFDPLGYHNRVEYRTMGAASCILQPFLNANLAPQATEDSSELSLPVIEKRGTRQSESRLSKSNTVKSPKLTYDKAFELIVCAFKKAIECANVPVGDLLVLNAITKDGCFTHEIVLRNSHFQCCESWL